MTLLVSYNNQVILFLKNRSKFGKVKKYLNIICISTWPRFVNLMIVNNINNIKLSSQPFL